MFKNIKKLLSSTKKGYIILLSGKAGSGKDVVADYLVNFQHFEKFAFADALKTFVSTKYGIDKNLMYSQEGKKTKVLVNGKILISVRDLLIKVATRKRKYNPDLWVDVVIGKIKKKLSDSKDKPIKIVISDFRYKNEYEKIVKTFEKDIKIFTIRLERDLAENIIDPSETSLDDFVFDKTLTNNSTKARLYTKIEKITSEF